MLLIFVGKNPVQRGFLAHTSIAGTVVLSLPSAYNTEGVGKLLLHGCSHPRLMERMLFHEARCVFWCLCGVNANFVMITNTPTAATPWIPSVYYAEGIHEATAMEVFALM